VGCFENSATQPVSRNGKGVRDGLKILQRSAMEVPRVLLTDRRWLSHSTWSPPTSDLQKPGNLFWYLSIDCCKCQLQ